MLPRSLVGESQLRIPNFDPEIMFSNMMLLLSVELEYHAERCIEVSQYEGICCHHQMVQRIRNLHSSL